MKPIRMNRVTVDRELACVWFFLLLPLLLLLLKISKKVPPCFCRLRIRKGHVLCLSKLNWSESITERTKNCVLSILIWYDKITVGDPCYYHTVFRCSTFTSTNLCTIEIHVRLQTPQTDFWFSLASKTWHDNVIMNTNLIYLWFI